MNEHLGYEPGEPVGRNRGNSCNGKRAKTVIVRKRQRRLSDLDQVVLSLSGKGLTTGEISAHLGEVYGAEVPKDTVTRITTLPYQR